MDDQQNTLTYEIIKVAVAGERWVTEKVFVYYGNYMTELARGSINSREFLLFCEVSVTFG